MTTDLIFKSQDTLQAINPPLLETLTHAVKPADIATFLGRKRSGNLNGEMGNRFNKRWLGTRYPASDRSSLDQDG